MPSTADEVFTDTQSCASRFARAVVFADLSGDGIFVLLRIGLFMKIAAYFIWKRKIEKIFLNQHLAITPQKQLGPLAWP
jgi:ABC-type ATPase with predicted acetyltransferase domain